MDLGRGKVGVQRRAMEGGKVAVCIYCMRKINNKKRMKISWVILMFIYKIPQVFFEPDIHEKTNALLKWVCSLSMSVEVLNSVVLIICLCWHSNSVLMTAAFYF